MTEAATLASDAPQSLAGSRWLLVDGHALAYRAYFALAGRGFTTRDGRPTGAIFGFTKMLLDTIGRLKPTHVSVAFDLPKPTFRHQEFEAYKANRSAMADDMIAQMAPLREVVDAFSMPRMELEGYEADDLLGTVAYQIAAAGGQAYILTGDRDTFQLVRDGVRILYPSGKTGEIVEIGPSEVFERMGVHPEQVPDLKGISGDSSDNIPGVPGIGDKGAAKLLAEYGTLEGILENVGSIKGKIGEKMAEHRELALQCKRLATIVTEAPFHMDPSGSVLEVKDLTKLTQVLSHLEFHSIVKQLPNTLAGFAAAGDSVGFTPAQGPAQAGEKAEPTPPPELVVVPERPLAPQVTVVRDEAGLKALSEALAKAERFAVDTETDGLGPHRCGLVGLAVAVPGPEGSLEANGCQAFYVPVGHGLLEEQVSLEALQKAVGPAFLDPSKVKIAHHMKFDLQVLRHHGMPVAPPWEDTLLLDQVLHAERLGHGLKELAKVHLGYTMTPIEDLLGKGAKAKTMVAVPVADAAPYAGADVGVTLELAALLLPRLEALGLTQVYEGIEKPLIQVVADMETHGVALDREHLAKLSHVMAERMAELEAQAHEAAGEAFNLNSPKQLAVILFEKLGLPVLKRTKTGPSTDAEVLEDLAEDHALVKLILEHRQLQKLRGTYVEALPTMIEADGRVHTSYSQMGAATGRMSSNDPNLQNIPIRTEMGREIRAAFVAGEGKRFVAADYSQVELRVLAHYCEDPSFLRAFQEGLDVHAMTASEVFGVELSEVSSEQRRMAKAVNFGVVYGQTDFGLSRTLGISRGEAKAFIEGFHARYPGVRASMIQAVAKAKQQGFASTLLGRRRALPELKSPARQVRDFGERMAINTPIQGTAADLIKLAMARLVPKLTPLGATLVLQVHDELVVEAPEDKVAEVGAAIQEAMEGAYTLKVPLVVDVHDGATWREAK